MLPQSPTADNATRRSLDTISRYHDGTKHAFDRMARSLGYLDWASQPRPFRSYTDARVIPLFPCPDAPAEGYVPCPVTLDAARGPAVAPAPLSAGALGDMLRHALGLSAWKQFGAARWSLRVNPSSGNLHPTEAYVIAPGLAGLAEQPAVYHYSVERHALELRCAFDASAWALATGGRTGIFFVALTSIHWREAWKYGERAFRYCQHDLGHAAAAVSIAASLHGWHARIVPTWSHRDIATLTGIDRDQDFIDAEREEPECVIAITAGPALDWNTLPEPGMLVDAALRAEWSGRASQLSDDHLTWSFIDEVAEATQDAGQDQPLSSVAVAPDAQPFTDRRIDARALLLQRRSAVAFDGHSSMDRHTFLDMLARVVPDNSTPWTTQWWSPRVHLALFVHRVEGVSPGMYVLLRDPAIFDRLRAACRDDFEWEAADGVLPLWRLREADTRAVAQRLSCNQGIAADGCFSLGMLADFDASLQTFGPTFYRQLFWETGLVGQVLYLEAEAAGVRGTGIGCFFDDPVHEALGLQGHAFQSLYHFTVGTPLEDSRLTTEPGYAWERPAS